MLQTTWPAVYREIAKRLVEKFKSDETAGHELYNLFSSDPIFPITNSRWVSRLQKNDNKIKSIDPIAVFASFNNYGIKEETRLKRINALLDVLECEIGPFVEGEIDFRGCPTPLAIRILSIRPVNQQKEIWEVFRLIFEKLKEGLISNHFNRYKSWIGIDLPSFSIFLFWIDSKTFLPLDRNTVSLLKIRKIISRIPETFDDYLNLINDQRIENKLQFSIEAFESRLIPLSNKTDIQDETKTEEVGSPSKTFRLLGLNVFEETNIEYRKVLRTDHVYQFYQAFDLSSTDVIQYYPQKDIQFYNTEKDPKISISAIVGKNGSGKSTLTELFCMALNNIAAVYNITTADLEKIDGLSIDFYYNVEHLYKVSVTNDVIKVYRYKFNPTSNQFHSPNLLSNNRFPYEDFFYSLYINYSLYALNSKQIGEWIRLLFHKNDSYQVPLALSPHRIDGVIDINKENELVNSRLLSNVLTITNLDDYVEDDYVEDNYSGANYLNEKEHLLRKLTDTNSAEFLELSFNPDKVKILYIHKIQGKKKLREKVYYFDYAKSYWLEFVHSVCKVFKIDQPTVPTNPSNHSTLIHVALKYALSKAIRISQEYKDYKKAFNPLKNKFNDLEGYIEGLKADNSHVAYKFKQAIYFIKFLHLRKYTGQNIMSKSTVLTIPVKALAEEMLSSMGQEGDFKTIHFVPPPFFKTNLILKNEIPFSSISSGEKQKIYTISSLIYHLINLDSKVKTRNTTAYRYVHIFFDEVELYFHPEMQRCFIKYLHDYLKEVQFENLAGINITFITHSPFILSDIPNENILFMEENSHIIRSLGANIHDLLATNFFLGQGVMGEFAKELILDLANYLNSEKDTDTSLVKEKWTRETAKLTIEMIGEQLLRERLQKMYDAKFYDDRVRLERIASLKKEIEKLENNETIYK